MAQATARYRNFLTDSARWDRIRFRDGDIVISTPAKCGTTWTQMICALLIFQTPDLPRPLDELTVWPDFLIHRIDELVATLEAQRHRRFVKTHTPLDGLPYDERVTYICVGRDPRDAAISWDHHVSNMDMEKAIAMRVAAVGTDGLEAPPEPAETARDRFWEWVDNRDMNFPGLAGMLHHLATFWRAKDRPNVVLMHYDDLRENLDGQMRQLAARLRIDIPEAIWPDLVRRATFDHMRHHARQTAPEPELWLDLDRFFRRGTSGQWRDLLDADDVHRYRTRVDQLAEPELAHWVHRGPITAG